MAVAAGRGRILIDVQELQQGVDQVEDGGREVKRGLRFPRPTLQVHTVAFVFLQGGSIEDAKNVIADPHGIHLVIAFTAGFPVEGVHVLKDGSHAHPRQQRANLLRQVVRR